ncbi:DAK2 domain-containing protein [Candidatus Mycoplasma pogonae]
MKTMNLQQLKSGIFSAAYNMENNKDRINAINVFPVPDGDTGTNMAATIMGGIENINEKTEISSTMNQLAKNMLFAARGNSGVILSQIFKGFSKGLEKSLYEVNTTDLLKAFEEGKNKAYDSVLKPVEGTILTVIREIVEGLKSFVTSKTTVLEFFEKAVELAKTSCANTPNILPVLKEVGTTDSGGEGLVCILEGFLLSLKDRPVNLNEKTNQETQFIFNQEIYDGEFGYCTEVIVNLRKPHKFDADKFKEKLENEIYASSIVVVRDEKLLKVHAHVAKPGKFLNFVQKYGEFLKIKSENMQEQASETKNQAQQQKNKVIESGIISCNNGQGIIDIMQAHGAHFIIESSANSNPSISDFIEAIKEVNSENIFVLPNNSNFVLAAQQAAKAVKDKNIIIIPTKNQMQGINAIMHFNEETDFNTNKELIMSEILNISEVKVTQAAKKTVMNDVKINIGDYLGILDGNVVVSNKNINTAVLKTLEEVVNEDTEIITIYYGAKISELEANDLSELIEEKYSELDLEIEIHSGNQDLYDFLISIE